MSTPILPFAPWQPGTNQNSIPANDNSLRQQILNGLVIGVENDDPGGSADGDIYIVGSAPTGAFATFIENDLAILDSGTWYAYAPSLGIVVNVAGTLKRWNGSAYVDIGTSGSQNVTVITEGSAFTVEPATHAGRDKYIRAADDITFNSAESYTAGEVYNFRATGSLSLIGTGVTLTAPSGGTLDLTTAMAVSVIMTSGTAGDVIGQTVPA